jgi:hypothetical protein
LQLRYFVQILNVLQLLTTDDEVEVDNMLLLLEQLEDTALVLQQTVTGITSIGAIYSPRSVSTIPHRL